ncbi:MAG TPA: transglycosylase SLT domain-containing protein [Thermoleophilaceae bacterium]|nr:transglycosylase SLT domain-containing protein [Thermoleophilaceae bacterium]
MRRLMFIALLLAGLAAAAFVLLRDDDPPIYSPLEIKGDPYAYEPDREQEFEERAAAGHGHVVYAKSPGGVLATARRVERFRGDIEQAADEAGVDPDLIEGMVLLESAGRPDAIASDDLEGAVGLTQILAETATSLLDMQVDVRASERLTRRLARARGPREAERLRAKRRRVDERFDPRKSLAATGRYLKLAMDEFGREDLAVVSYHMGIGNLQGVLGAYGDDDASYTQVFFDSAPNNHARAYRLLMRLGDDSKTYLWRVLASHGVMRLYRDDRARLERLAGLQESAPSGELVLHPPDRTKIFETEDDLSAAYLDGELRPFPNEPRRYGLRRAPGIEDELLWGLRPRAFELAVYMARGVRQVGGTSAPLTVTRLVRPGAGMHSTGYAFDVSRDYRTGAQAEAFQYMLDRLQALNLIAWTRSSKTIHVTASQAFELGD